MKIKSISTNKYTGKVYNIATPPISNYFANGILVHNCYMSSDFNGKHCDNLVDKTKSYFAGISENLLPFQVAIGGGEPFLHPELFEFVKYLDSIGIVSNITTNGLNFNDENLAFIKEWMGGVAVTAHKHVDGLWQKGLEQLIPSCNAPAIHVLLHDKESIDYIKKVVDDWYDKVYTITVLPFKAQGRGANMSSEIDWEYMTEYIKSLPEEKLFKLSWGALAYDYIKDNPYLSQLSLYEPEQFSRFLDMTTMKEYNSSFEVSD